MEGKSPTHSSTPAGAVFLSYASEDAVAAERIATTLRAAGIEVWFDQSELRGGEAWDREIRRQIRDCDLFIPVISMNAHARDEGYFRLEWKLAIDRSHLMAPDKTFLLPIVIDNTPRTDERIPDRFRELQWSPVPDGQVPAAFIDRVRRLLSPAAADGLASVRPTTGAVSVATRSNARPRWLRLGAIAAVVAGALLVGGYALWRALSATGASSVRMAPAEIGLPAHTVAVLPFENISADPNDGFLATGIAESVLHRLAAVKRLSVIARTSSFTFRGHNVDARDIGRRLNARYLVEGSVQRAGERLRVTAQLLDASSGSDVWSLRFERRMGDIFELEDEISGKVADALAVSLQESPGNGSARRTPKLDAYLAYLEGRSLLSTFKIADAQVGIERLRRATEIDPAFAAAYAEEAHGVRMLQWLLHPEQPPDAAQEKQAAALVEKALSLDPELGEAWVEQAYGRQLLSNDPDPRTDADFRKGLALAPNYAQGYELYGEWLDQIGRKDDALAMIERARQLDPLAPRSHYRKALMLIDRGDLEHAVPLLLEALRADPTYHPAIVRLGSVEWRRGNFAEAVKFIERAIAVEPDATWMRELAAGAYLNLADTAAAEDMLVKVPARSSARWCLLLYKGEAQRAAAELHALPRAELNAALLGENSGCQSTVIRDDALARRQYDRALGVLEMCPTPDWDVLIEKPEGLIRAECALRYATLLMAAGARDRATKIIQAIAGAIDRHGPATGPDAQECRASAAALLGDADTALKALETAFATVKGNWWYLERAPEFESLHAQPRFQSLVRQYHDIVAKQRALLAAMRSKGEVPWRPASAAAAAARER
jgi:TolB-like protein/tetratricopeptide (TPR) repeat protein